MSLQDYLTEVFTEWSPPAPEVVDRTKNDITLTWENLEPFNFLAEELLFRVEKDNKLPKWIVVYSGGKTTKKIQNLAPCHPHTFRLKVVLKSEAVPTLASKAILYYGDEETVYKQLAEYTKGRKGRRQTEDGDKTLDREENDNNKSEKELANGRKIKLMTMSKWIESSWSDVTWTSTDTDGSSAVCFSMAVRCGYLKQVLAMLEERPDLICIVNTNNGFTPLTTAVRKGDINMVRFLLLSGAEVNQGSSTGQTALHLAILSASIPITELLFDMGADFTVRSETDQDPTGIPPPHLRPLVSKVASMSLISMLPRNKVDRDPNGLRAEHCAVDSCDVEMLRFILDKGGDVTVQDNNGWTPLFRALCQGAKTEIIEELVNRGSDVTIKDYVGLPLTSVARLLKNRHGENRHSIMHLVDSSYPHEKALANFTRLTKKIHNVHSVIKLG